MNFLKRIKRLETIFNHGFGVEFYEGDIGYHFGNCDISLTHQSAIRKIHELESEIKRLSSEIIPLQKPSKFKVGDSVKYSMDGCTTEGSAATGFAKSTNVKIAKVEYDYKWFQWKYTCIEDCNKVIVLHEEYLTAVNDGDSTTK